MLEVVGGDVVVAPVELPQAPSSSRASSPASRGTEGVGLIPHGTVSGSVWFP